LPLSIAAVSIALMPFPVVAGSLHPALRQELERSASRAPITVIVELVQQEDVGLADRSLKRTGASRAERHRRIVEALRRTANAHQAPILAALERLRAQGEVAAITPYWIADLVRVTATPAAILALTERADVRTVHPREKLRSIEPTRRSAPIRRPTPSRLAARTGGIAPGVAAIRADEVWSSLGVTGQGALIGILDSGVDATHPALAGRWRGNNGHAAEACWLDVQGTNSTFPTDLRDHGTHVAGTALGLDAALGDTIGVAWGAQWIAANAIGDDTFELTPDVLACFQWFAEPDGDPGTIDDVPDVIQNSWGVSEWQGYADCTSVWNLVIDNCEAAGIVVLFAAGNQGPTPASIDSPADRATSEFNGFSIGAVDATNFGWPYPIAAFSSRGPSPCTSVPAFRIKPEVCAPGVRVYSSIPGGQYMEADGTSMAGPHVAGVVALMRSVNPDIEVDAIKQILIETARDEGVPGEDNDYGWGCIDAYEAVVRCLGGGYGTTTGQVVNVDGGGTPVPFARVRIVETNRAFTADASGQYWGLSTPGAFTLEVSHPSFATQLRPGVVVVANAVTTQNFGLDDTAPPAITDVVQPAWIENPAAPILVRADLADFSPLAVRQLIWRLDGSSWQTLPLAPVSGDTYEGNIPGQPVGSVVHYYIRAGDLAGNVGTDPFLAPAAYRRIEVLPVYFADDAETDEGWSLAQAGDTSNGTWVRRDPWGTNSMGVWVEPPDDHTPGAGTTCFVTGAGQEGGFPDGSDVDAGCVNLTSPRIDMSGASQPAVSYWRWFALVGLHQDATFEAKVSNDDGQSWTTLESVAVNSNAWVQTVRDLAPVLALTPNMRFRFTACDTGSPSLVEAGIDDFLISVANATTDSPGQPPSTSVVHALWPNPFTSSTRIRFSVPRSAPGTVTIHDVSGRRVRTLFSGRLERGTQDLAWDGCDANARRVAAGVYFCEVRIDNARAVTKLLLVR
jgi:subtilisin family serine protease